MTELITKKKAEKQGLNNFFTGKPCKHGHISTRGVKHGKCNECNRAGAQKQYEDNPEKCKAASKQQTVRKAATRRLNANKNEVDHE